MNHAVDEHLKERMFSALFAHMAVWGGCSLSAIRPSRGDGQAFMCFLTRLFSWENDVFQALNSSLLSFHRFLVKKMDFSLETWQILGKNGLRKEVSEDAWWESAPRSVHCLFYRQKRNSSHILHLMQLEGSRAARVAKLFSLAGQGFYCILLHLLEFGADWGLPFWEITSGICVWGTSCFSVTQDVAASEDFNFCHFFIFPFLLCWNSIAAWNFSSTLLQVLNLFLSFQIAPGVEGWN